MIPEGAMCGGRETLVGFEKTSAVSGECQHRCRHPLGLSSRTRAVVAVGSSVCEGRSAVIEIGSATHEDAVAKAEGTKVGVNEARVRITGALVKSGESSFGC